MATCSLGGAADLKLFGVQSELSMSRHAGLVMPCKMKCSRLESFVGLRGVQTVHGPAIAAGLDTQPRRLSNAFAVSCLADGKENNTETVKLEEKMSSTKNQIVPGPFKVQSLLTTICDTTSIAEVELKIGGFRVYVKRDLAEKSIPAPVPSQPPAPTNPSSTPPDSNGSATASSLAISKPKALSGSIQSILESASDEGLVILQSPKVGFFRTSRTIKGKRAPPSCKEKQQVKEGQVLCYVEQLGGEMPIESDVSGEVIKILRTDGEPVGYGDALIVILPSFPGIKKLQ